VYVCVCMCVCMCVCACVRASISDLAACQTQLENVKIPDPSPPVPSEQPCPETLLSGAAASCADAAPDSCGFAVFSTAKRGGEEELGKVIERVWEVAHKVAPHCIQRVFGHDKREQVILSCEGSAVRVSTMQAKGRKPGDVLDVFALHHKSKSTKWLRPHKQMLRQAYQDVRTLFERFHAQVSATVRSDWEEHYIVPEACTTPPILPHHFVVSVTSTHPAQLRRLYLLALLTVGVSFHSYTSSIVFPTADVRTGTRINHLPPRAAISPA